MSATALAPERPAAVRGREIPIVQQTMTAFSVTAAAPAPTRGIPVPQAIDQLRALSAPRARVGGQDVEHGPQRRMLSQMCASGLIDGRAWAPLGTPSWIAHGSAQDALTEFARGILYECRAAGMDGLRMVVRVQSATIDGLFLDARAAPDRPALFDGPENIGATHRLAVKIAAGGRMAGALLEGGRVVVLRLGAIVLRPLGHAYEIRVAGDGSATARRIAIGKGFT